MRTRRAGPQWQPGLPFPAGGALCVTSGGARGARVGVGKRVFTSGRRSRGLRAEQVGRRARRAPRSHGLAHGVSPAAGRAGRAAGRAAGGTGQGHPNWRARGVPGSGPGPGLPGAGSGPGRERARVRPAVEHSRGAPRPGSRTGTGGHTLLLVVGRRGMSDRGCSPVRAGNLLLQEITLMPAEDRPFKRKAKEQNNPTLPASAGRGRRAGCARRFRGRPPQGGVGRKHQHRARAGLSLPRRVLGLLEVR